MLASQAITRLQKVGLDVAAARRALSIACARGEVKAFGHRTTRWSAFSEDNADREEGIDSFAWRDALATQGVSALGLVPATGSCGWIDWQGASLVVSRADGPHGDYSVIWTALRFSRPGVEALADRLTGERAQSSLPTDAAIESWCSEFSEYHGRNSRSAWKAFHADGRFARVKREETFMPIWRRVTGHRGRGER